MITFTNPWWLLLLLAVPPLLWLWHRRRTPALRHPNVADLAALPAGRSRWLRRLGLLLRGLVLVLLVVALAGPRRPDFRTRIATEGIALMLLLDVSGSMAEPWPDDPRMRIDVARQALHLFVAGGEADGVQLPGRPTDLIGYVAFARRPEDVCPLTLSHTVLLEMLDAEQPRRVPGTAETNLSDAIVLGLHRLRAAGNRRQVLVVFSDGEHNVEDPASTWKPRQAAQLAGNLGVPVYTIDASDDPTGPGSDALRQLAEISKGRYFEARDPASLLHAYQEIDRAEREQITSFVYRRYFEGYPWFGLAALVVFTGILALDATRWRRLP